MIPVFAESHHLIFIGKKPFCEHPLATAKYKDWKNRVRINLYIRGSYFEVRVTFSDPD